MSVLSDNKYAITLIEKIADGPMPIAAGTLIKIVETDEYGALTFTREISFSKFYKTPRKHKCSNIEGLLFITPNIFKFAMAIHAPTERMDFCRSKEKQKFICQVQVNDFVQIPHGSFSVNDSTFRRALVKYIGCFDELGPGLHFIVSLMNRNWTIVPRLNKEIKIPDSLEINWQECVILSADHIFEPHAEYCPHVELFHLYRGRYYQFEPSVLLRADRSERAGPQSEMWNGKWREQISSSSGKSDQAQLKSYEDGAIDKEHTLIRIITKFARSFRTTTFGISHQANSAYSTALYRIIHEDFEATLNAIQPFVDKNEARDALRKISPGPRPHLFDVPPLDVPFEDLVKRHIARMMEPSVALISLVLNEIKQIVRHCDTELEVEWKRFPKLKAKIVDSMANLLNGRVNIAKDMVKNIFASELAYINKRHPDFHKAGPMLSGETTEKGNCEVLQLLVQSYVDIVRKTVLNAVPKAIMHSIVNFVVENVESELLKHVYKAEGCDMLLEEESDISRKREHARSMLQALTGAK